MHTILLSVFCIGSFAYSATIQPFTYSSLPIGAITPSGWLQSQLEIQAAGLTGHLSKFWHGVNQSSWIIPNGHGDNQLEEFTPYWMNGLIPLHFLVPDNDDLSGEAWQYISYILANRQSSDGWLGVDDIGGGNMYWGRWNLLNAFRMYAEGNKTMANTLKESMLKYMLQQEHRMIYNTTYGNTWSGARWMDFVLSAMWLLENGGSIVNGYEANITNAIEMSYQQGFDWEDWYEYQLPHQAVTSNMNLYTHGVNNAQGFKSAAVKYRYYSTNETLRNLSLSRLFRMDEYHGQATGMFGADEHLAGRMPSRGTETCTVVEYMWSFQIMFRVFGDIRYLDRLERVAVNALPATFGSPTGGDMWSHQYLQQNNEINSMFTNPHVWASDGPNATIYGLEPNYGCCTANFNQGWPKFSSAIYFTMSNPSGIAIGIYAPSKTNDVINGMASFNITTNYPFEDDIYIYLNAIKSFDLYLRIPHWANNNNVVLKLDNNSPVNPSTIMNGTLYKLSIPSTGQHTIHLNFNPSVRIYEGWNGSVALLRGSLLFSLPIQEQWETVAVYDYDSKDYWCLPKSKWNYALDIKDLNNIEESVKVKSSSWVNGHAPFNRTDIPIMLEVNGNELYTWVEETGAAQPPPMSPACANTNNCNQTPQLLQLVPHGTTDLRIAEFPLANTHY